MYSFNIFGHVTCPANFKRANYNIYVFRFELVKQGHTMISKLLQLKPENLAYKGIIVEHLVINNQ